MLRALRRSLARKVLLAAGLPCAIVAFIGLLAIRDRADHAVRDNTDQAMLALAEQIATAFELAEPGDDPHRAVTAAVRADWNPLGHVRDLRVVGRDGVVRWSRRREEQGVLLPDAARILALKATPGKDVVRSLGGMQCAGCHADDAFFVGALHLSMDEPKLARDVGELFRDAITGTALLLLLLAALLLVAIGQLLIRPLSRLQGVMKRAERGDFLVRAPVDREDELGRLAVAFNGMLAKITDLNVAALETGREVDRMQEELQLKAEVEKQATLIEETNRSLEARVRELTLLFDVTRSMNATLELGELLKLVTELVGVTLGFTEFAVLLLDAQKQELEVKATYGFAEGEDPEGLVLRIGEGVSGEAARSGTYVLVPDVTREERFLYARDRRHHGGSFLSVPMLHHDEVVGLLNFARPEADAFSAEEIRLLTSVAGQAALAIANARLYAETVELSLTDPLTRTANRRHLFSRLEMEVTRAQRFGTPLTLIMIDIDHFKHLNDNAGHSAGDEVLRQVASVLQTSVRKVDTLARFGGEEFAVILPQIPREEAAEVAEKLRRNVAKTDFPHGEGQPGGRVTISVGFAAYPTDASELAGLIDAADSALYVSKRTGRNRVTSYAAGMEQSPGRERAPEGEARHLLDPPKPVGPGRVRAS